MICSVIVCYIEFSTVICCRYIWPHLPWSPSGWERPQQGEASVCENGQRWDWKRCTSFSFTVYIFLQCVYVHWNSLVFLHHSLTPPLPSVTSPTQAGTFCFWGCCNSFYFAQWLMHQWKRHGLRHVGFSFRSSLDHGQDDWDGSFTLWNTALLSPCPPCQGDSLTWVVHYKDVATADKRLL